MFRSIAKSILACVFLSFLSCSETPELGPSIHKLPDLASIIWEKTPEGLEYFIIQKGNGKAINFDMKLESEYTGWYADTQKKYASSLDRGKSFRFKLNTPLTMKAWDIGLLKINKGGKIYLKVPPKLGYKKKPKDVRDNVDFIFGIYIKP